MRTLRRFGLYSDTWLGAGKWDRRIFLLIMLLHLVFMIWYNTWQSPACDESDYFSYALRWAKGNPERIGILDDSKTPMVFPALWSLSLKTIFPSLENNYSEKLLLIGRLGMYVYFFFLSFVFFCWSKRLFGALKWVLPWILFLTDPLLISNAILIGSDLASGSFMLGAFYLGWRYSITRSMRYWWLLSIVCGFALLIKLSMIIIIPMMAILLWASTIGANKKLPAETKGKILIRWVGLFVICGFIINAGYQFSQTGTALKNYQARSVQLKNIQVNYPVLSSIPIPVPIHYISSYDLLLRNASKGGGHTDANSYHGVYLNGKFKTIGGFRDYYLWHFFYKITPILLISLIGASLLLFSNRTKLFSRFKTWSFVWLPPLGFILWLSVANPFQIGIRHAVPAWPFFYLLAGPFFIFAANKFPRISLVAVLLQFSEITWHMPNLNAYTPIWMQPKQTIYKRMRDSNLSYCNDVFIYKYFLEQHPEYKYPTVLPSAGKFALRLNDCNQISPADGPMSCWLLKHFTPKGHYKTTILLFEISNQEIKELTN